MDRENPLRALRRTDEWVFGPKARYEREGDVDDVVVPCGWIVRGGMVYMYYGAADSSITLATAKRSDLIDFIMKCPAVTGGR